MTLGPTPSKISKNQKSFLKKPSRFGIVFGFTGGSDDMKIANARK